MNKYAKNIATQVTFDTRFLGLRYIFGQDQQHLVCQKVTQLRATVSEISFGKNIEEISKKSTRKLQTLSFQQKSMSILYELQKNFQN